MGFALNVTFVGIFVVFLALVMLSIIVFLFSRIFSIKKTETKNELNSARLETSVSKTDEDIKNYATGDGDELLSVLTAAVLASIKSGPDYTIQVKSFRRIPQNTPVWNIAGRTEHIASKL